MNQCPDVPNDTST